MFSVLPWNYRNTVLQNQSSARWTHLLVLPLCPLQNDNVLPGHTHVCSSWKTQKWNELPHDKTQQNDLCAQSDQRLRCPREVGLNPKLPKKCTAKTLIRLRKCPGWSKSTPRSDHFVGFCWGSTVGFLLLHCSSGVVRHPRDLQVSVATRFCWVLLFASS